ncbi:MAG: hypothetical protein FJ096_00325 [Deltaproteobacteria bacterium]|nr:hypothetical protein [Deltaproteobacteria bacterium]
MPQPTDRLATLIAITLLATACKKKQEPTDEAQVPVRNTATLDVVSTDIGTGLALRVTLAPTSVKWDQSVTLDDDRAVLLGREGDQVYALRTSDRGRTWTSVTTQVQSWTAWGASSNGALALVTGTSERPGAVATVKGAPPRAAGPIVEATTFYASPNDRILDGPRPFFPDDAQLKGVTAPGGLARPALLEEGISLLVERAGTPTLLYAPLRGTVAIAPTPLERRGGLVAMPYGRPPRLVSVDKGSLESRPWPAPGQAPAPPTPIPDYRVDSSTVAQLSEGPSCEAGSLSFRRVQGSQPWLLGISADRAVAFRLPPSDVTRLGCGLDAVVTETTTLDPSDVEKKRKVPQLVRCALDGRCAEPKAPPFAVWTEKHEREIWTVPTSRGLVAVMRARSGSRWGLYLGQSNEGGNTFELPRTIGEGSDTRGQLDFGALVRFQNRIVLLISADVGSSGRRGWYALASDDEGNNWGPP